MTSRLVVVGWLLGIAGCSGDGELRDGVCYTHALECRGPCPTYDESVAAVGSDPCGASGLNLVKVGTCGPFLYTSSGCGFGGGASWFSADGKLVARESVSDTPIETPCGGDAFALHEGIETSCTPVAAPPQ